MEPAEQAARVEEVGYAAEAVHFFLCGRCGQYVDRRKEREIRHHQRLSHRPLEAD